MNINTIFVKTSKFGLLKQLTKNKDYENNFNDSNYIDYCKL